MNAIGGIKIIATSINLIDESLFFCNSKNAFQFTENTISEQNVSEKIHEIIVSIICGHTQ